MSCHALRVEDTAFVDSIMPERLDALTAYLDYEAVNFIL